MPTRPTPRIPMLLLASLLLLFTTTATAASAVLGIDLGSSYLKAALVKPGTPLDIVLTKDSKRKEASVVGFKPPRGNAAAAAVEAVGFPERLYGGDALALGGRFPGDVYANLKGLLGLGAGVEGKEVLGSWKEKHPAVKVEDALEKEGSVLIYSSAFKEEEKPWRVEELLAMELKNIRANAEAFAGKAYGQITDAVVTVPVFYTADEKRALERAAQLAGINIMGLVSDGLAVGIDYTVKRDFPNVSEGKKPEIHMVFDMGATSTTATIMKFNRRDVKDIGRFNKTVHEVTVLGSGWDRKLGGDALNKLIYDYLVEGFVNKPEAIKEGITGAEVRGHGRTAAKLWREAERARQVLSANSDVRSSFEGLYKDIDFATKLSRADFEKMAESYALAIKEPIQAALNAAKLTMKDLDSIIMHGGVIRTPFVQKQLEALSGKDTEVRANVNSDESAAHGAAFKAAGLSPSFRVKEIRDSDAATYAAGISYPTDGKQRQQKLFQPTSQIGPIKQLTLKNLDDFDFDLFQTVDAVERPVLGVHTDNLTASVTALQDKFGCGAEEITTSFNVRLSPVDGLPEVVSGSVSCEVEGSGKAGGLGDSVKGLFGFGSKKGEQEPLKEGEEATETQVLEAEEEAASSTASSATAKASGKAESETKSKKRTESINIALTTSAKGLPQPAAAEMTRMKERLAAFDRSDKARVQREEALNVLEAFTYRTRDMLTDSAFEGASTEAVRSELSTLLSSTSEWLSDEGATATTAEFKKKLAALKALVEPVQERIKEAASRPAKLESLQSSLDQTKSLVSVMREQIAKAASSLSEAASSATEAVKPNSAAVDDEFADLEAEEADATTASESPKPSKLADFTPYSEEDLSGLSKTYEAIAEWLGEKTGVQDKLKPYEDPALTVKEIEAKAAELNKAMMDMLQKKMQIPKRSSSSSSKKAKATKSKKSSSTSTTSGTVAESETSTVAHEEL